MKHVSKYLAPLCWFVCVATIAIILYVLVSQLLNRFFPPGTLGVDILQYTFGDSLGMFCCFCSLLLPPHAYIPPSDGIPARRAIQRRGPLLLGFVFLDASIAHAVAYIENIHHIPIAGSWADLFYIGEYPLLLGMIFSLPTRPLSRTASLRIVFDSILIMTAVLIFSWYFFLGPIILYGQQPVLGKVSGASTLFCDLVLLFSLLILASRSSDVDIRPAKYVLLLGIALLLIGDGFNENSLVQSGATNGTQQLIFWSIAYAVFIISAYYMRFTYPSQSVPSESRQEQNSSGNTQIDIPPLWRALLPSAFVPAVIVLVTYVWLVGRNGSLAQGVYLGGAMLLGQVVLRQVFSLREIHFYTQKLRLMQQELQIKNLSLGDANLQLEVQASQIERAYEQQRRLNDLKDQFLLNVNHELRTPLTEILGYLELLQDYQGQLDSTQQTQFIKQALHGGEELLMLINNVMETIRTGEIGQAPSGASIVVHQVVTEVLTHFLPHNLQDHPLRLEIAEELSVQADRLYLRQILRNLLSNALKYTPVHSEVVVRATILSAQSEPPQSSPLLQVCLSVQDYGDGIPPEELPLLFGKFVRLQRDLLGPVRGTGLGLYICKQLVESMGGHIWVESAGLPGQGSCFSFTLPAAVGTEAHMPHTGKPGLTEAYGKMNE